jgi:hypothetical protein
MERSLIELEKRNLLEPGAKGTFCLLLEVWKGKRERSYRYSVGKKFKIQNAEQA